MKIPIVFCTDCEHIIYDYESIKEGPICNAPENIKYKDTFHERRVIHKKSAQNLNKNNDCKFFKGEIKNYKESEEEVEKKKGLLSIFRVGKHEGALSHD